MKALILSGLLGGFVMFAFGAAYWMNPLPKKAFASAKDDVALQQTFREGLGESGTYVIPNMNQEPAAFMEKHKQGPNVIIHYHAGGMGPESMGPMMIKGLIFQVLSAFVLALLMKMVVAQLPTYGSRVKFATIVGVVAVVFIDGGNMNWWFHSVPFTILTGAFHILSFTLAGLVIAKFIRPEEAPAATAAGA
jgi:hypothetical protein